MKSSISGSFGLGALRTIYILPYINQEMRYTVSPMDTYSMIFYGSSVQSTTKWNNFIILL